MTTFTQGSAVNPPVLFPCLTGLTCPRTHSASAPPSGQSLARQHPPSLAQPGGGVSFEDSVRWRSVLWKRLCAPFQSQTARAGCQGSWGFESCRWRRQKATVQGARGRSARQAQVERPRRGKGGGGGWAWGALSVCLSPRPPSAYRRPLRARGGASCHPLWMPSVLVPRGRLESPRRWGQEGHWAGPGPSQNGSGGGRRGLLWSPQHSRVG